MKFKKIHKSLSVAEMLDMHTKGKLNLNPGFQRSSVWTDKEKKLLIDTIFRGMPLPNIFLWEHREGRKIVYDVIDGKQRIESLIAFTRRYSPITVKFDPDDDSDWSWKDPYEWSWKELNREEPRIARQFRAYRIPVVVVNGNLSDVEKVFIRINSTGKRLTAQEMRHARWYQNSDLLREAEAIAKKKKYQNYFVEMGILSPGQLSRMKAIELILELMLSIKAEDVLDRKSSLDKIMGNNGINKNTLKRISNQTTATLDAVAYMFPLLHTTRFSKASDFYALSFVVWKLRNEGFNLRDKKSNEISFSVMNQIGVELAEYKSSFHAGARKRLRSPVREYQSTIVSQTDSARQRRERVRIIESILRPIYGQKDIQRLFTIEQKQLLWHGSKDKVCANSECRKALSWRDVRMDHIKAHTKGGKTDLANAQILCVSCNSRKGAK